jgi:hypothetical protein
MTSVFARIYDILEEMILGNFVNICFYACNLPGTVASHDNRATDKIKLNSKAFGLRNDTKKEILS